MNTNNTGTELLDILLASIEAEKERKANRQPVQRYCADGVWRTYWSDTGERCDSDFDDLRAELRGL